MNNVELSSYLFFSNDPRHISKIISSNNNFITYHLIDQKKILKGYFNNNRKNSYCEEIDYSDSCIKITCGCWKDNELIGPSLVYIQSKENSDEFYISETGDQIKLERIDMYNFATPNSLPYWYYHPKNIRNRKQKNRLHY